MLPCRHHAFQRTDCPLSPFLSVFSPTLGLACLLRFEKISFPNGVSYDASSKTLDDLGIVCYALDPGNLCFGPDKFNAQEEFDTIVQDAVELKSFTRTLGGFAAINYPTFFHHPKVRVWRKQIFARALQLQLFDPNMYVAMGFDRMMYRLPTQAPSAENMHRDISPF